MLKPDVRVCVADRLQPAGGAGCLQSKGMKVWTAPLLLQLVEVLLSLMTYFNPD